MYLNNILMIVEMEEAEWNVLESIGVGHGYVEYVAVWKGNEKEQELGHDSICHRQIACTPVNVVPLSDLTSVVSLDSMSDGGTLSLEPHSMRTSLGCSMCCVRYHLY